MKAGMGIMWCVRYQVSGIRYQVYPLLVYLLPTEWIGCEKGRIGGHEEGKREKKMEKKMKDW